MNRSLPFVTDGFDFDFAKANLVEFCSNSKSRSRSAPSWRSRTNLCKTSGWFQIYDRVMSRSERSFREVTLQQMAKARSGFKVFSELLDNAPTASKNFMYNCRWLGDSFNRMTYSVFGGRSDRRTSWPRLDKAKLRNKDGGERDEDLPLNETFQETVQNVSTSTHYFPIFHRRVNTLTVENRTFEHIAELHFTTEIVRPNEIDHTPVF